MAFYLLQAFYYNMGSMSLQQFIDGERYITILLIDHLYVVII